MASTDFPDPDLKAVLIAAAVELAPWVSASLTDMQSGHTGEYKQTAERFLWAIEMYQDGET